MQKVAAELDYRPHPAAQQLANGVHRTIAFMVRADGGELLRPTDYEYFGELMEACTAEALTHGYQMMLMPSALESNEFEKLPLAGVVLVDPIADDPMIPLLGRRGIPIVTTGRDPALEGDGHWVDNDHGPGTAGVLDHLAEQGAQKIALVNSTDEHSHSIDARSAYEDWCKREGRPVEIVSVGPVLDESAGFEAGLELLESEQPPDAIHAVLDRVALGVLLAARSLGVRVPQDLLLSGTTDTAASQVSRPALTVLSLQPDAIGRAAAVMLIELIEGKPSADRHQTVPTFLIERASSLRGKS